MSCSLNMLYISPSGRESKDLLEKNMLHKQQRSSLIQRQNTPFKTIFFSCSSPSPQPSKFSKMASNTKCSTNKIHDVPLIHIRKSEQDGYMLIFEAFSTQDYKKEKIYIYIAFMARK